MSWQDYHSWQGNGTDADVFMQSTGSFMADIVCEDFTEVPLKTDMAICGGPLNKELSFLAGNLDM